MKYSSTIQSIIDGKWKESSKDVLSLVPAQLNLDEKQLLYYCAREMSSADGALIDGGAFLGGSAKCLSIGLRDNPDLSLAEKYGKIHTYDHFIAGKWMPEKWFPEGFPSEGSSTLRKFVDHLGGLMDYVTVHQGDVANNIWPDMPIDVLFLDLCKLIETTDRSTEIFFPYLIPGRSIVIQQDYIFQSWNIWIYVVMELLADYFEVIAECRVNSVAFLCIKEVTEDAIKRANVGNLTHQERIELALKQARRFEGEGRRRIEGSVKIYMEHFQLS